MMLKLSLTSVKKRWQDYLVLMMGLMISIAIFYMFQTLSLNSDFLKENIPAIQMVVFVFQLGAILLGMITVVYILYANSFLLSMRKKEYVMYMMLGAKKRKISQMIAIETIFIGLLSMVIGGVVGTGLAQVMGNYLSKAIDLPSKTYVAFVPMALLVTVIFFGILFIITTIINVTKFRKTRTLDLLYSEGQSERRKKRPVMTIIKMLISLVLIGIGYYCMMNIGSLQLIGVFIAIFTITPGTFLFFGSLVPVVVSWIKGMEKYSSKGIRIFTLSQLSFKASSLARVLGLVTMLLALSLGAVTVGQAFKNFSEDILKANYNDVVTYNATADIQKEIDQLDAKEKIHYQSKTKEGTTYFVASEFENNPLLMQEEGNVENPFMNPIVPVKNLKVNHEYSSQTKGEYYITHAFSQLADSYSSENTFALTYKVVSQETFDTIDVKKDDVQVIRVEDYMSQVDHFKTIHALEKERNPKAASNMSKYDMYQSVQGMASGFMFMGFFLGFAFLAMLASCLMFKILSGAYQDVARYDMLHKIGVRRQLLVKSLRKEIFIIFLVPALLGVVHVLVGLKMFTMFIPNPYQYIALPFAVYSVVYFIYYVVTAQLYKNIVLPKIKS